MFYISRHKNKKILFLLCLTIVINITSSINANWLRTDKAHRYYRIGWQTSKICAGAILGAFSIHELDKKFTNGLIGGLSTIFISNGLNPKKYPVISALIASSICIHSGIEGLRKEL